jgi:uncharacterized membrane protein YphA (DoxX/SURF4 family)
MDTLLKLGKYLFALPFAMFGIMHFTNAESMAGYAPFGGVFMVYFTGLALIAAVVSILIGKMDKLASFLLGVFLILTALLVHAKGLGSEDEMQKAIAMTGMLKDLMLAGAAWLYAAYIAKDNAVLN